MRVFEQRMKEQGLDDTKLAARVDKTTRTIQNYYRPDNPTTPDHPTGAKILIELKAESWDELMKEVETEEIATV